MEFIKKLYIFLLAISLLACASSSNQIDSPIETPTSNITEVGNPPNEEIIVNGNAIKGPIENAHVVIYKLNSDGSFGEIIANTETTKNGGFKTKINFTGPVVIVVTGGTYIDEATESIVELNPAIPLILILPANSKLKNINITPLTTIASLRIIFILAQTPNANISEIVARVNSEVAELFNLEDTDLVYDHINFSNNNNTEYEKILIGLSMLIAEYYLSPESLILLIANIAEDFSDGIIDNSVNDEDLEYDLGELTPESAIDQLLTNDESSREITSITELDLVIDSLVFTSGTERSVDINNNTIIAGFPLSDDYEENSGVAYIFECDESSKECPQEKITRLGTTDLAVPNMRFGTSVAIDNNIAVVGAPSIFEITDYSGIAYVYIKNINGTWPNTETFKLIPEDPQSGNLFGQSVAVQENIIVVGSPKADSNYGAVYVFEKDELTGLWNQIEKLSSDSDTSNILFGYSVAMQDNTIVIGTPNLLYGPAIASGGIYIYSKNLEERWIQSQVIFPEDPTLLDSFGYSVDIDNDYIVVGAPNHISDSLFSAGTAYIYKQNTDTSWSFDQKIISEQTMSYDNFGNSVSISDYIILIGSPNHDLELFNNSGQSYLFTIDESKEWIEHSTSFDPSDVNAADNLFFGNALAIDNNMAVILSSSELDSNPTIGTVYWLD